MSIDHTTPGGVLRRVEDLPALLTRRELSEFTGVKVQTLARWASERTGPKVTKLGGAVRYRREDVIAFVDKSAA